MAEDKGYWFTTETGVHIHVEPGQSKKEAMEKKFGKKVFEPSGGFERQVDHEKKIGQNHSPRYEKIDTEYFYKGDSGSYTDMIAKYGRTEDEVRTGKANTFEDKQLKKFIKDDKDASKSADFYNKVVYGHARENTVNTTNTNAPTYTRVIHEGRDNREVASIDSTGKYTGSLNYAMKGYDWKAHHGDNSRQEFDYAKQYNKGANYKQPDWMAGRPKSDWTNREIKQANKENKKNIKK